MTNFLVALALALLAGGCYSYRTVETTDRARIFSKGASTLRITPSDGFGIRVEPGHYVEVTQPESFLFGEGMVTNTKSGSSSQFRGRTPLVLRDSGKTWKEGRFGWDKPVTYIDVALNDSEVVRFHSDSYVHVDSSEGVGLWITGSREVRTSNEPFTGRVPFESVIRVETHEFSAMKTGLLILGIGTTAGLAIWRLSIAHEANGFNFEL